jgi:insulysin
MQLYEIEDVLFASKYLTDFNPEAIETLLEYLTPEKIKIMAISKKYQGKTDRIEKWYGTEYKMRCLERKTLEKLKNCGLNEAFKLPEKNPFIPSDLSLMKHAESDLSELPRLIHSTHLAKLWYKEDSKFLLPKVYLKFAIRFILC